MTEATQTYRLPADGPKKSHDMAIAVSAAFIAVGLIVVLYAIAQATGVTADELSTLTAYP